MALDLAADGRRRHVEYGVADTHRQPRRAVSPNSFPQVGHKQIGNQRDGAGRDRACSQDRDDVAARILARTTGDVLGRRKQLSWAKHREVGSESPDEYAMRRPLSRIIFARNEFALNHVPRPLPLTFL